MVQEEGPEDPQEPVAEEGSEADGISDRCDAHSGVVGAVSLD